MAEQEGCTADVIQFNNLNEDQSSSANVPIFNYPLILIHGRLIANETDAAAFKKTDVTDHNTKSEDANLQTKRDAKQERHEKQERYEKQGEEYQDDNITKETKEEKRLNNDVKTVKHKVESLTAPKEPDDDIPDCDNISRKDSETPKQHIVCQSYPSEHSMCWPISQNGTSKIFVPLKEGKNCVSLKNEHTKETLHEIEVIYEPIQNKRYVRPVYIICKNSDGTFDAPSEEDNSVESAKQRIQFNARILQTFTAENLHAHGFGRKTFRLEEDEQRNVKVNVFRSELEIEKAHEMTGAQLYDYFHKELQNSELKDPYCKFWVFMSCTRYKPPNYDEGFDKYSKIGDYAKGHTALGGGNMALFGTGCLHTWARNLEELVTRFSDDRKIDRRCLFDDSGNRGFFWANYATTIGAAMHELGHSFNLPHTSSGIMGRGFDEMHLFCLCDVASNKSTSVKKQDSEISPYENGGAHWNRASAAVLSCCRWIGNQVGDNSPIEVPAPTMCIDPNKRGPVGFGFNESEENANFDSKQWLEKENLTFAGLCVKAGRYINAIQFIGKTKVLQLDDTCDAPLVTSKWYGNHEANGEVYEFILNNYDEKLVSIDVRAGSWLDAIRFHSDYQSSIWIGGDGGHLYNLKFEDGNGFEGLFGTAGQHVTSIGISRISDDDVKRDENYCHFNSPYGIRVIEIWQRNGEVIKHWEFLEGEAKSTIRMPREDLLAEGLTYTVAVYDGLGERADYDIKNFILNTGECTL